MLRTVPTSVTNLADRDVLQRLRIDNHLAILLVRREDFFVAVLQVSLGGSTNLVSRFDLTGEVSDAEVLSARLHDLKACVEAMLVAGFALPPVEPKAA